MEDPKLRSTEAMAHVLVSQASGKYVRQMIQHAGEVIPADLEGSDEALQALAEALAAHISAAEALERAAEVVRAMTAREMVGRLGEELARRRAEERVEEVPS